MIFDGPNIKFNEVALNNLLNNPKGGPGTVGAYLRDIGRKILVEAKGQVGVRTGVLRRSMYMRQGVHSRGQYVEVGATDFKAYMHHEGTRMHEIRPHGGRIMRFNVGGTVVYARKVLHPGTAPNPYLREPMKRVIAHKR